MRWDRLVKLEGFDRRKQFDIFWAMMSHKSILMNLGGFAAALGLKLKWLKKICVKMWFVQGTEEVTVKRGGDMEGKFVGKSTGDGGTLEVYTNYVFSVAF